MIRRIALFSAALGALILTAPLRPAHADEAALPTNKGNHASLNGPTQFSQQDGAQLYQAICQGCHMPNAQGGAGVAAFPALAKNPKLEVAAYPLTMVVNGNRAMPAFKGQLSDQQIAAVVGYVRTHFGNSYAEPVTAADAKMVRDAGK
jgi:mono/diheme cytochrome c family protein